MLKQSDIPHPKRSSYRRFKTPTVIQMEATECGAAALSMILGFYGRFVPLEDVRMMCSVSREGVSAYHILRAAEHYGLDSKGYSLELKDLYTMPLPLIAFWSFNHFVVIEGFDKKSVFINDPASGPRKISYQELNNSFTGVILTFIPNKKFQRSTFIEKQWFPLLWKRFKLFRAPILFSLLIGLIAIVPQLTLTVLSQVFVDNVLLAKIYHWEFGVMLGIALVAILATAIHLLQTWITTRFSIKLSVLMSSQFVWHTLRLPFLFFIQRYGGEVASRLGLIESVVSTWVEQVLPAIVNIVFTFLIVIIMLYYDVAITLTGITIVFLNLALMGYLYRSREDAYADFKQIQGRMISFAISGLESIESIKSIGGEHQFLSQYGGMYTKSLNTLQKIGRTDLILGTFSPFLTMVGSMAVLIMGAIRILQGYLTIGEFFALQLLFNYFTTPVLNLTNLNQTIQLLRIHLIRLDDLLRHPEDRLLTHDLSIKKLSNIDRLQGEVEIKNVSFGFSPLEAPTIKNMNLSLKPGECIALVGPSGCGKSTVIRLIGGILSPWSGEIEFDKIPFLQYPREVINRSISIIEQTSYLFEESIEHNISLMASVYDEEALIQASKDACIHEEIMSRPGGYQSLVQKQGTNFSGGQRQRLEIACALSRNPSIIILDEATSSVDSVTEKQILENIRKRGQTCMIVTHRLSTISDCDTIFVMDKGEIVQKGNHEELSKTPGVYQTLIASGLTREAHP